MGKLEAFKIDGLECWFNSSDHLPAHFHVEKTDEWEIRVFFFMCSEKTLQFEYKWKKRVMDSGTKTEILDLVIQHREAIAVEWEKKVNLNPPGSV